MKREVVICDDGRCRRLADHRCLLCERDLCDEHGTNGLMVMIAAHKPGPSSAGVPQVPSIEGQKTVEDVRICGDCYQGLATLESGTKPKYTRVRIFEKLAATFRDQVVAEAKAALAAVKLEGSA